MGDPIGVAVSLATSTTTTHGAAAGHGAIVLVAGAEW
jgi:hypothetical protein